MSRFLKLTIAYDGTGYAGWQVQPDQPTIQGKLEETLKRITRQEIRVTASGRTDAGVHALGQVVGFEIQSDLSAEVLCRAINAYLPRDIVVLEVTEASPGFHAIRDAIRKRYRYVIDNGPVADIFSRHYAWYLSNPKPLNIAAMHEAAQHLLGKHDFTSFEAAGSPRATSVRTIHDIFVRQEVTQERSAMPGGSPKGMAGTHPKIIFEVEADGFLYNMVRNIVGTLVEVGQGGRPIDWVAQVRDAKNRKFAGPTAPPQGLFLVHVEY